jgi:DNA-binding transcriptional LysR family regulator
MYAMLPARPSFDTIREFVVLARRRSFRGAAAELGIDKTVLSRRISRLEQRLGVRLLHRTTRNVTVTEAGIVYLRSCEDLLSRLSDAEAEVSRYASAPTGLLRLGLPNGFGQRCIAPLIPDFMAAYPDLRLELMFSDRMVDLVDHHLDAAVRIGALQAGGDLKAKSLMPIRRLLCAAPAYLARQGEPHRPEDLARHHLLHFSPLLAGPVWRLVGQTMKEIAIDPILSADNVEMLRLAAKAARGIVLIAEFAVEEELASGDLVPVLAGWEVPSSTASLVYPDAPFVPQKVRALADFLEERCNRPAKRLA